MCKWTRWNFECFHDVKVPPSVPCERAALKRLRGGPKEGKYFCPASENDLYVLEAPVDTRCLQCGRPHTALKNEYRNALSHIRERATVPWAQQPSQPSYSGPSNTSLPPTPVASQSSASSNHGTPITRPQQSAVPTGLDVLAMASSLRQAQESWRNVGEMKFNTQEQELAAKNETAKQKDPS